MSATLCHDTIYAGASCAVLARVLDLDDTRLVRADLSTITYTIAELLAGDVTGEAVDGHEDVSLTVADVLFDTLSTGSGWDKDSTGWNFRHVIETDDAVAFPTEEKRYQVEYTFTTTAGRVIKTRFVLTVK